MYEGFTDRACRVLLEMRDEAGRLDHDHTGTEHLLLAIVKVNDHLTAPVLHRFGINEADLRREVQKIVTPDLDLDQGRGVGFLIIQGANRSEAIPPQPADNRASPRHITDRLLACLMRLAPFESNELSDEHVGPEHLLLAVLKEGHGIGVEALTNLGVDINELRMAVYQRIADAPGSSDPTVPPPTDEDRQASSDIRRAMAQSRMSMEDRVVFTSDRAATVYCVLDGLDRLLDSGRPIVDEVADVITESFKTWRGRDEYLGRITPEQERQFVRDMVSGLRRQAMDQLGD